MEAADKVFYAAGETAGRHFYENLITKRDSFGDFVAELQEVLKNLGIGILRVEKGDLEKLTFTLTVAEDSRLFRPARMRRADLHL